MLWYKNSFAQMCLLIETLSQLSNLTHGYFVVIVVIVVKFSHCIRQKKTKLTTEQGFMSQQMGHKKVPSPLKGSRLRCLTWLKVCTPGPGHLTV